MRQIKGQRKGLSVWNVGDKEYHRLYNTIIVERDGDKVTLNTGGWKTNHTKNCMNDFLKLFGFGVVQKDFVWYIRGREVSFSFDVDKVTFTILYTSKGFQIGNFREEVIRTA